MTEIRVKEGDGKILLTMPTDRNTTVNDIVVAIHEQKQIPLDKISLLLPNDLPLELNKKLHHYNNPTDIFLATEVWLSYYSEEHQKAYYYDPYEKETKWELPIWAKAAPGPEGENVELLDLFQPKDKHAKYSHLIRPSDWLEGKNYLKRPARKQIEKSYNKDYAYKQGDDEYNIWYDKYFNDRGVKERAPASTRCDPIKDIGYCKADIYEPETAYLCLHFIRGCCSEGANCRFFHHMPSLEECKKIQPIKDIFGRTRHANHRDDMQGIGCFQKESRTLYVSDIKLPPGDDPIQQVNEMLWRHFSIWGRVEDVTFIPQKCIAFIKYYHRCYAEIAKEAMTNQALDYDEMLSIKWANDDQNPARESQYSELWHKQQIEKEREDKGKKNSEKKKGKGKVEKDNKVEFDLPKKLPPPVDVTELERQLKEEDEEKQKIDERMKKMNNILDRIKVEQPETLAEIIFPAGIDPTIP
ncbi:unnamed protein product [Blepharisma stoltei]|uniref:Uncharacterized protein n=1 Tax=Blepharisma stoltei TaxID=1481888 RepID=A0AAU9JZ54_9CILI|nr:unnamed protein product [Blepharisma stoltei]